MSARMTRHEDGTTCAGARCAFITTGGHTLKANDITVTIEKWPADSALGPCDFSQRDADNALLQCTERVRYQKAVRNKGGAGGAGGAVEGGSTTFTYWCDKHIALQATGPDGQVSAGPVALHGGW